MSREIKFNLSIAVTAFVGEEQLETISNITGIDVDDLTDRDIADCMIQNADYVFDIMPEGEEPLAESCTTEIIDYDME